MVFSFIFLECLVLFDNRKNGYRHNRSIALTEDRYGIDRSSGSSNRENNKKGNPAHVHLNTRRGRDKCRREAGGMKFVRTQIILRTRSEYATGSSSA